MDANLLHTSYEGKYRRPMVGTEEKMFLKNKKSGKCSRSSWIINLDFETEILQQLMEKVFTFSMNKLNLLEAKTDCRLDIVENRFCESNLGVYETPGGEIILAARRAVESLTLDRESCHLKDEIMPKYAKLIWTMDFGFPRKDDDAISYYESQKRLMEQLR